MDILYNRQLLINLTLKLLYIQTFPKSHTYDRTDVRFENADMQKDVKKLESSEPFDCNITEPFTIYAEN